MAIESPHYDVLRHDGKFELRKYDGYLIASVEIESDSHAHAGNEAFNILADYIFGNNSPRQNIPMTVPVESELVGEKIAMTAPVTSSESSGKYKVSFTMPSSYTIKTLPMPNNARVKIEKVAPQKLAVVKFSGYTSEEKIQKMFQELREWCNAKKIKVGRAYKVSRFDAPIKPGFLRHNEISIIAS